MLQDLFMQWIYSEKKEKVQYQLVFWYLSIMGGIGLLIYAISRKDPVIILGQSFGIFIYLRNLILIYRNENEKINNYIDGKIVKGSSSKYIPVDNPATGEKISKVIQSDIKDFENTVKIQ